MYKIEYDLTSPAVANNLESLTAGFRRFIPQLAKDHLEKDALFSELAAEGRVWLQSLYTAPADAVLSSSAIDLREVTAPEKMADYQKQLAAESGAPTVINLVRAQYYKKTADTPALVALQFLQAFNNNKNGFAWLTFTKQGKQWKIVGVRTEAEHTR